MPDRPAIGDLVHFVQDEPGTCRDLWVHSYLGTAGLRLADAPLDQTPTRYWVAVPSDLGDTHAWHPPCT